MSWKRNTSYLIAWSVLIGLSYSVEVSIDNPNDGFFLKPIYDKHKPWDPSIEEENFVVTKQTDKITFQASSGPFDDFETITGSDADELVSMTQHGGNHDNHFVYNNFDVSAHIVSRTISPKWPKLQVLIHASPHNYENTKYRKTSQMHSRTLCGHVFVRNDKVELSSICVISSQDKGCVSSINLPGNWWNYNNSMDVYYAVSLSNQNQECASASNSIKVPDRPSESDREPETSPRKMILSVILTKPGHHYDIRQDKHILVHVPREMYEPRTIFEIPVKLEANSTIQVLVMRCRVKDGLKITGAIAMADGPWQIHVDINERKKLGSVTAFVRNTSTYRVKPRIQDIFKWQLEVEDESNTDTGRIVWNIEYERTSKQELYISQESRIIAHINIRSEKKDNLVPVVKVNEVLNLAMLTGIRQVYPLWIYKVSEKGSLAEVTHTTACHSVEDDIMKVASNCSHLYLDGTERRGSHNVTIITKSGRHTAFIHLTVWIPKIPLEINLSDGKLSLIRGWKVASARGGSKRSRNKRLVDLGMLTHPSVYLRDERKKYKGCHLRYQQAALDIFGVFYIATSTGIDYYRGKKAALKMTDLLQNRLRVSDPRIAQLKEGILQGVGPGVTEVQVLSPNGRVIAASEVRVGSDKVSLTRLVINVITGVTVDVLGSTEVPGALLLKAHVDSQFRTQYQEGIIDISLQFSDDTRIPLRYVNPDDYYLDVSTSYHHLVGLVEDSKPYQPRIVAFKEGRGELFKILFELGKKCRKKKSLPLQTDIVMVNADFSLPNTITNNDFMNDRPNHNNHASERRDERRQDKPHYNFKSSPKDTPFKYLKDKNSKNYNKFGKASLSDSQVYGVDYNLHENLKKAAHDYNINENVKQGGHASGNQALSSDEPEKKPAEVPGLSPLEIGMYVLLAVFCVGLSVFFINCVVFMYRHKKKQAVKGNKGGTVAQANDWVWIGRATLERNAINTQCSQTLMPVNDFNGNQPNTSVPVDSGVHSAQSSNRSSFVSTIKGSECSIRITANPLPEELSADNNNLNREPEWDYEAMGMTYDQLAEYFDNLKESTA